jgi:hypothetical protein
MTQAVARSPDLLATVPMDTRQTAYQPGVCNIGPAEIARRRRAGNVGLVATVGLLAGLVAVDAPPVARLLVAVPAAVAASGYLQARLRFCAGFGSRGVFNFGEIGGTDRVEDTDARRRDLMKARQIGLRSLAIGLAVGAGAALLPV